MSGRLARRSKVSLSLLLSVLALSLGPPPARAAESDRIEYLNKKAMEDYDSLEFDSARRTLTDRLDSVALHRWFGIPVFLATVLLVFRLTFSVAAPFVTLIGGPLQDTVSGWAAAALGWAPFFLRELVVGAIIPGVGTVLSFLPTLLVLYLAMSFLEDSGYMARAAFLADRLMRSIGLDGRAFIPLILGFGCNVPAVYATRTLEKRSDRVLVSMILPFMSCSARLPVYIIFAAALFRPRYSAACRSL